MSKMPEEFLADMHKLTRAMAGTRDWVARINTHMGILESNGLKQEEAIREAGVAIAYSLESVAGALRGIADEMREARRADVPE